MKETVLFNSKNGRVTNLDFFDALCSINANEADVLYIHTALNFGVPGNLRKKELLDSIYDTLRELGVETIIFPAYTFSFCNGVGFDVQHTKTQMGLLNDFVRQKDEAIRSVDPLMSNVLVGKHTDFVTKTGKCSVGKNSTFDLLHNTELKVKFLFFGPKIGDCFTYMHFIEERENVPYRYRRMFTGEITDGSRFYEDRFELFVRYGNVFPGQGSYVYENILLERGIAKKKKIGDSAITILEEEPAYDCYLDLLKLSPSFYISEPFDDKSKTTTFHVKNMVAL
ncbi:MAG: AAC(3) family N-acetyltransferase [Bacteroidales bacterium]|nr:AAC(3) family N-acetyltransferase [Bacteroidales bacterium]